MQEVLKLVSSIKLDIERLREEMAEMKKTHIQVLCEEWITAEQVMTILRICPRTLQSLKSKGLISCSKINGIHLYRTADIEQLLNRNYLDK
jgi:hypothetical protein